MKIEQSPQVYQGYKKTTNSSASKSTTFQQALETRTQDRYVSSVNAQSPQTKSCVYGGMPVCNATYEKLKQLEEINRQADYTGMSPDEIYAEIWNRYDEAFDGNMIAITGLTGFFGKPTDWCVINNQFVDEIVKHIVNPEEHAAYKAAGGSQGKTYEEQNALLASCRQKAWSVVPLARDKVLGYAGMNFDEREAAIKEKYTGKNTILDFLKMQGELEKSGVLRHKMGDEMYTYCYMIGRQLDKAYNPNCTDRVGPERTAYMTMDQWNRVLHQPFDAHRLAAAMKEHLHSISSINGYSADIINAMEECIDRFVDGFIGKEIDQRDKRITVTQKGR